MYSVDNVYVGWATFELLILFNQNVMYIEYRNEPLCNILLISALLIFDKI